MTRPAEMMRIDLRVLECDVAIEAARGGDVLSALHAAWRPALRPRHPDPQRHYVVESSGQVALNGAPWRGDQELSALVPQLELDILRAVVTQHASSVILHAGAVVYGQRLLLFVGESGAGKTSFTREALRRGASYLSDDLVIITDKTARGLARTVQFDPLPRSDPIPSYLLDCDCESYQVGDERKPTRVPLWIADHVTLEAFQPARGNTVVVGLQRAEKATLLEGSELDRYRFLHAASLVSGRTYDGCLGNGPTWAVSWTDPAREFETLLKSLRL